MSLVAEKAEFTPEDLLAMPDASRYELIDGKLVERRVGYYSCMVAAEIIAAIVLYLREHPVGILFTSDLIYQCFPDHPNHVRKADASVILRERLPEGWEALGVSRVPPDLAVEVNSLHDVTRETDLKVAEYRNVGVRLVWVVHPEARAVRVQRADGTGAWVSENEALTGEDVLPGFACKVGSLFPAAPKTG